MNKTTAFALLAVVMAAPAFAQDYPPTTTQSTDTETQMKAEDATRRTMPPGTTTEQTTTSNDAAEVMTSGDAAAAMQSTGMAAATATGVSTAVLTGNVVVTSRPGDSISSNYRIDFAALDTNRDGNLSHGEVNASGNEDLIREFVAVDNNHNGRLSKDELKGWMD